MTQNEIDQLAQEAKKRLIERIAVLSRRQAQYALCVLMEGVVKTVSAAVTQAEARYITDA